MPATYHPMKHSISRIRNLHILFTKPSSPHRYLSHLVLARDIGCHRSRSLPASPHRRLASTAPLAPSSTTSRQHNSNIHGYISKPTFTHNSYLNIARGSRTRFDPDSRPFQLRSAISNHLLLIDFVIVAGIAYLIFGVSKETDTTLSEALPEVYSEVLPDGVEDMAAAMLEGRPGNLTTEQEEKLRKLWQAVFHICGVIKDDTAPVADTEPPKDGTTTAEGDQHKKKRFGMFRRKHTDSKGGASSAGEASHGDNAEDDKYGLNKAFNEAVATQSPETIRQTIWSMVKCDHPDAVLLRFLRARKWDVEKALVMLVSTMHWRDAEMHVDDEIMKNGEATMASNEKDGDANAKKLGKDFMAQIRMGKSFLHGTDKQGRPICIVRVRLHKQGEQCEESLERYTVYIIETARMVLTPPVDTATIVFDMTGFSMANMDYTPVKFMIKCFEANYPESLGAVLVHNSPWIFQGIWKIIRGWLDPVVASKVHFTNNVKELEEFIEPGHIMKDLGGQEAWDYTYIEPVANENEKMNDTATRDRLLQQRAELVKQFEATTMGWIEHPEGEDGKKHSEKRQALAKELKDDYWRLDPYLRARTVYDRQGTIKSDGKVDWYAVEEKKPTAETSADDVD